MKTMQAIDHLLTRVGMTSHQSIKTHPFNKRNSIILFISIISFTGVTMYLIYSPTNLKEYTDSIFMTITMAATTTNYAFVTWKMTEMLRFIDNLEDIVSTRLEDPILKTIYMKTSEKIAKIAKIVNFACVKVTPALTILPTFFDGFVAYYTTDLGTDAFVELALPMRFPFDVENPLGYGIAAVVQFTSSFTLNLALVCVLIIVIAPCLILISAADDIKCGLNSFDTMARTNENDFKIIQQFNQCVQFHSKIKQLVSEFSEMSQFIFMVHFSWSIGSICLNMFAMEIELRDNAPTSIVLQSFNSMCWSFAIVFISCEFGHKLSASFEEIDDAIIQMHWYKFSSRLWKLLPILMCGSQGPVYLRVFGSTSCTREAFQRVVNCAFSYFMVLNKFDSQN